MCVAIIRQKYDPQIWYVEVVEFCRFEAQHGLRSAPTSPVLPRFRTTDAIAVIAPQPRHPLPNAVYAYRSGMGPEYQIEHFRPSSPVAEGPVPSFPAAAPLQHVHQSTRATPAQSSVPAPSLYPQLLRSSLMPQQPLRPSPPSPPPLGIWPRPNAVDQPPHSKRKPTPATFRLPARGAIDTASGTLQSPKSSSHRSRPSGPRTSSGSNEIRRPPPLDLTRISTFRNSGNNVRL